MANNQIEWCISELINIKEFPDKLPITKDSITSFVDILISNAKARTGITEKNIKEYNKLFYEHLDFYFRTEKSLLDVNSDEFKKLCSMFKVPVIKNNIRSEEDMLPGPRPRDNENFSANTKGCEPLEHGGIGFIPGERVYTHEDCMDIFSKLSTTEKIKFIMELQNVEIKLSPAEILVFKSC